MRLRDTENETESTMMPESDNILQGLLGEVARIAERYGPLSNEVRQFILKNREVPGFESLATTLAFLKKAHADDFLSKSDKALLLATKAHAKQTRKNGEPYVCHPIRVAARAAHNLIKHQCYLDKLEVVRVAALLHDTIEDTNVTYNDILEQFGKEVADVVQALSRPEHESYESFVERCSQNPVATFVKVADLEDNTSDLPEGHKLWNRYKPALVKLRTKMCEYLENRPVQ